MLCLSRKIGEQIVIGDGPNKIVVTFLDIRYSRCRIGIEAQRKVPVERGERRHEKDEDAG